MTRIPTTVAEVMTAPVLTVGRNDVLSLADDIMQLRRVRHLCVLDDHGRLVGVVSQRDLFRGALATALGYGESGQERIMKSMSVKEVMSTDVATVKPETPLAEAARFMLKRKVGALPVVEDGRVCGIVTESDFVKLYTEVAAAGSAS